MWIDGLPTAPFVSRERVHGTIFASKRIAFTSCSKCAHDAIQWIPTLLEAADDGSRLWHGVVSVECCVSGVFFREYPSTSFIVGDDRCHGTSAFNACKLMLAVVNEPHTTYSVEADTEILLFIPGYCPPKLSSRLLV